MKTYVFLGILSLLSLATANAQEYLDCKLKISDNRIDCPFFSKCHHKPLKTSETKLELELFDGDTKTGKIDLKRVLVKPGTDDEKDNEIIIFKSDKRIDEITSNSKAEVVAYDLQEGIKYKAQKLGDSIDITFKTSVYNMDISLSGESSYSTFFPSKDNLIQASCEKISKAIFQDRKAKEIAIKDYKDKLEASKKVKAE